MRPETITIRGSGARPSSSRFSRLRGSPIDPPVALGAHRSCADHHRICPRPQAHQELGVPGASDFPRDPVDRRVAVERQGEVHEDVWALGMGAFPRAKLLEKLGGGYFLCWLWQEAAHAATVPIYLAPLRAADVP